MQQWEYQTMVLRTYPNDSECELGLNVAGKQGWELVNFQHVDASKFIFIFKRPINTTTNV